MISTVTIQGKVVKPDGSAAPGSIRIRLSEIGTVDDAGTEQVIATDFVAVIEADGTVDFEIIPTDLITFASGNPVSYIADYSVGDDRWRQQWINILAANDPLDIGDIGIVLGVPRPPPVFIPPTITSPPPAEGTASDRGKFKTFFAGPGKQDVTYQCLKGFDDKYYWREGIMGGGPY